ncbi:hypothetical protein [Mesorhizobium sp. M8A.F.Ca.ET.021.01.1.1]|uniref:hypothetical protein n=1 Tax=Mesorhizobium sp. M8A.F.Ca.ET.021.01.1.1 TaxID=2496757 RepID=UPI000FCB7B95|nr:hypothetical protein [Mesorhizobium sp. M8A.F.Ca.ET.021.01.1.1]RUW57115.1 hypothetical protein EOA36_00600 [Mesorhizobium sp. M8A.F.Ca.ET.021.01.1.1]
MTAPQFQRSLGKAKTRARALDGQGYKFHVTRPIRAARPANLEMDIQMSPITDEQVTVYSFGTAADMQKFVEQFGGDPL